VRDSTESDKVSVHAIRGKVLEYYNEQNDTDGWLQTLDITAEEINRMESVVNEGCPEEARQETKEEDPNTDERRERERTRATERRMRGQHFSMPVETLRRSARQRAPARNEMLEREAYVLVDEMHRPR